LHIRNSFEDIYTNFPEPIHTREAPRLIDRKFIETILSLLKPHGTMYVATDDSMYAACIGEDLAQIHAEGGLKKSSKPSAKKSASDYVSMTLPVGFGNSFFDELWKNKGRSDRFFVQSGKM
jgi:tRNA G46 methylase TrmB